MPERSFEEYAIAGRVRDVIKGLVESMVNQLRPPPRYAIVVSIDNINDVCTVRYLNETEETSIPMASLRPSRAGQVVRIEGVVGDRYISDVLGEAVIDGGGMPIGHMFNWPGESIPDWAREANGSLVSVNEFPELFRELRYRHGGSGDTFALPSGTNTNSNIRVLIRVR